MQARESRGHVELDRETENWIEAMNRRSRDEQARMDAADEAPPPPPLAGKPLANLWATTAGNSTVPMSKREEVTTEEARKSVVIVRLLSLAAETTPQLLLQARLVLKSWVVS